MDHTTGAEEPASAVTLVSTRSGPAGERVVVYASPGASVHLLWSDGRSPSDVTGWLPDLLLTGWVAASEAAEADLPPQETVAVATLAVHGRLEVLLLDPEQSPHLLDPDTAQEWVLAGVTSMITTGVAHEAADVPDTPAHLDH